MDGLNNPDASVSGYPDHPDTSGSGAGARPEEHIACETVE